MTSSRPSDEELLKRIGARDRAALEQLYHRYHGRLTGYLLRITRRPELAEEVLNDTMLTVWQQAARFEGRSRPSTWVFGIAYRKALKALSRLPREVQTLAAVEERPGPEESDRALALRELRERLTAALGELSVEQRAVVELTYFQELSYREIARILDCPENTVKTRMFHARRKLRRLLPELEGRVIDGKPGDAEEVR